MHTKTRSIFNGFPEVSCIVSGVFSCPIMHRVNDKIGNMLQNLVCDNDAVTLFFLISQKKLLLTQYIQYLLQSSVRSNGRHSVPLNQNVTLGQQFNSLCMKMH